MQSAAAGERDEHEPVGEAGRPADARRPAAGDDCGSVRDPQPAAGVDAQRGVLSERGQRGEARHGGYPARAGYCTAGQGRDRRVARVRRPARGEQSSTQAATARAGALHAQPRPK